MISKRELNVKDKLMIYRYIFMFPPSSEAVTCVVSKRKNEIADTGSENGPTSIGRLGSPLKTG